jgi:hypothetical protein
VFNFFKLQELHNDFLHYFLTLMLVPLVTQPPLQVFNIVSDDGEVAEI